MSTQQLTIVSNGQQYGPYGEDQIRSFLAQGRLSPSDLAWAEGMANWRPLAQILLEQAPIASTRLQAAPPVYGQMLGGNLKGRVLTFETSLSKAIFQVTTAFVIGLTKATGTRNAAHCQA